MPKTMKSKGILFKYLEIIMMMAESPTLSGPLFPHLQNE